MKRIFCLILAVLMLTLSGCTGTADPSTQTVPSSETAPQVLETQPTENTESYHETDPTEFIEAPTAPSYYIAKFKNSDESIIHLASLLKNRLYHEVSPYTYGNFRLTELATGTEYPLMTAHYFDFTTSDTTLVLDWEKAVSDGSGLFSDATLMIQVESLDGSWYVQFHNGSDADWIYISECDSYVPISPYSTGEVSYMNEQIAYDYDSFLWSGLCIEPMSAGTPEEIVQHYVDARIEAFHRLPKDGLTDRYVYGAVEARDLHWELRDDGAIHVVVTFTFLPTGDGELSLPLVDPDADSLYLDTVLIQMEDGNWYDSQYVQFLPAELPEA